MLYWRLTSILEMERIFTGLQTATAESLGLYGIQHSGRNVRKLRLCLFGLDIGCWEFTTTFRNAKAKHLVCWNKRMSSNKKCTTVNDTVLLRALYSHWHDNWAFLDDYAASSGNFIPAFRENLDSLLLTMGSILDSWLLKLGTIGCPETSVSNYHHSLRNNISEQRSSHLLRDGSLKSCIVTEMFRPH